MSVQHHRLIRHAKFLVAIILGTSVGTFPASAGDQPVMSGFPVFVPKSIVVPAQSTGAGGYGAGSDGPSDTRKTTGTGGSIATNSSQSVGQALEAATKFCQSLPGSDYTIDCLAYEYWEIQKQLPSSGELADVKKVLAQTSKQLRKLATDNQSTSKPPIRVSKGTRKLNRTLVPVDRTQLPKLSRDAAAIINNGATLLIRASGDSNRKRAQYQQIARSMRTGAIMLRSL